MNTVRFNNNKQKGGFYPIRNMAELTFKRTDCKAVSGTNGNIFSQVLFFHR